MMMEEPQAELDVFKDFDDTVPDLRTIIRQAEGDTVDTHEDL